MSVQRDAVLAELERIGTGTAPAIAQALGMLTGSVRKTLAGLVADGAIEITQSGGGRANPTIYKPRNRETAKPRNRETAPSSTRVTARARACDPPSKELAIRETTTTPTRLADVTTITPGRLLDVPSVTQIVFDEWRRVTGRTTRFYPLGKGNEQLIKARLREGFTVDDLLDAVRGLSKSRFHNGDNPRGEKFTLLKYAIKDQDRVCEMRDLWHGDKRGTGPISEATASIMRLREREGRA